MEGQAIKPVNSYYPLLDSGFKNVNRKQVATEYVTELKNFTAIQKFSASFLSNQVQLHRKARSSGKKSYAEAGNKLKRKYFIQRDDMLPV